jgi:predicted anti-sigma-YlaC factor YlaD
MTCSDFVEHFSAIYDGVASGEVVRAAELHLASCESCRRYRDVVERGAALLRALPAPEVGEDFVPGLQHRLRHVDDEAALRRHTNSGTTSLAVLGMAVLLIVLAWAPTLRRSAPVVELAPIVVSNPPAAARMRRPAAFSAFAVQNAATTLEADLWGDARTLLFQYSRLAQRYGQRPLASRTGLQQ